MKKSIYFNIETQTEDGQTISLIHVNEKSIALEVSDIAKTMFKLNRALFNKINGSTKLLTGKIHREEIVKGKDSSNRLGTMVLDSYDYISTEVISFFLREGNLEKQQRALSSTGIYFDFLPSKVTNQNESIKFDPLRPSREMLKSSTIISTIEQVGLFNDLGVKTFLFQDSLKDRKGISEVSYNINLFVDTDFEEYYRFVMSKAEESLFFLDGYVKSLDSLSVWNPEKQEFNTDYSSKVFSDLGIIEGVPSSLSTERVKNSKLGQASLSYMNLANLIKSGDNSSLYASSLNKLLPTRKTSPSNILMFVQHFNSVYDQVKKLYKVSSLGQKNIPNGLSRVLKGQKFSNSIEAKSVEKFSLEQEVLGYSIFSDTQQGLNKFTIGDYASRTNQEKQKYYPKVSLKDSGFLTPEERAQFSRMDNAPAFLTPSSLLVGKDRIKTNRGMKNIPIEKIRQFRLAKSSRAKQMDSTNKPTSYKKGRISNDVVSSFNFTVAESRTSLLNRGYEKVIDPLIDAKHYVGESSYFISDNPVVFRREFKRLMTEKDKKILGIISDVIPRRFLRNPMSVKSIKELQFSNHKSKVRSLATAEKLNIEEIPPHVKAMMGEDFAPNPNSDPLKNSESREIIEETQKNLFVVRALVGFGKDENGMVDLYNPIYENMKSDILSSGRPIIGKAFHYELPELGILKDKFAGTIYNNLIYIRG
jgi:hypothetical protein